jgi:hypothetical protein
MQVRSAKCVDSDGNEKTLEECDAVTPRLTKQTCQVDECPHWESGQWNSVSFVITQVSQQNVERNYTSNQFSALKSVVSEKNTVRFGVNTEIKSLMMVIVIRKLSRIQLRFAKYKLVLESGISENGVLAIIALQLPKE